ncbi:hypothetical protein KC887_00735 [Candidatus Kaiserbacteria bacterium]|nr:hypothetical protein [Candidatus Kaiserbacteria bacterium]
MEDFNKLVSTWITPILLGIVGFFVMGILNDVKDIKANQILFVKEQATMQAKLENIDHRVTALERWLDEVDKAQRTHEREQNRSKNR